MMRLGRSLALLLAVSAALPVLDAGAQTIAVHDAKLLTREQFAALPDGAVINTRDGRTTAGALRIRQRENAIAWRGRIETAKKTATLQVEEAVRRVQTEQKMQLDATNTRLRADATKAMVLAPLAPTYAGPPDIESATETIEPGSFVLIRGRGFGSLPGTVVMKGLPGGDRVLAVQAWKSTTASVVVPSDITGVLDQNVRLQLSKKDGTPSAEHVVAFKAAREVLHLLPATLVKCHQDATENTCDSSTGFFGVHTEDTLWEMNALGCDEWKIPTLKNGWTIQDFTVTQMSNGGGSVGGMSKPYPMPGATSNTWKACWTVPGTGGFSGNGAGYMGFYVISGPKGLSYK